MNKFLSLSILLTFFIAGNLLAQGKGNIIGQITDKDGNPLSSVAISLANTYIGSVSNQNGMYSINAIPNGDYILLVKLSGYRTEKKRITVYNETVRLNFECSTDVLGLNDIVVTGNFSPSSKLESSVAVATLNKKQIQRTQSQVTGQLLNSVPGAFIDGSSGEIDAKIYARGLSTGDKYSPGYNYVSLQENGLPVISTQMQFNSPDYFLRPDITTQKMEAIRGGSAVISATNSPGGIFNLISEEGGDRFEGDVKMQVGMWGNGNLLGRTDLLLKGNLSKPENGWHYAVGGFYRYDKGARDIPFIANRGGQVTGNITKVFKQGKLKIYGKFLDDHNTNYRNIPVVNFDAPVAAPGFNLNYSSLFTNNQLSGIPDQGIVGTGDPLATRGFDNNAGINSKVYSGGANFDINLGNNWSLSNKFKYSKINLDYQQFFGDAILDKNTGVSDFIRFPDYFKYYTYSDFHSGELLYQAAPSGNFQSGDYQVITDIMPNNSIYGSVLTHVVDKMDDIIEQLVANKTFGNHAITLGGYYSRTTIDRQKRGEGLLQTFEESPRLLNISHLNPFQPFDPENASLQITDPNGVVLYGLYYENEQLLTQKAAVFLNDVWKITDQLILDAGVRYEFNRDQGTKEDFRTGPTNPEIPVLQVFAEPNGNVAGAFPNGTDGVYTTVYDIANRIGTGNRRSWDFSYQYLSYSLGLNYEFNANAAIYGRYSRGNKSPESNYYVDNFLNEDPKKGAVEAINMGELGVKFNTDKLSMFSTLFFSQMDNVPFNQFQFEPFGSIFSPTTFNSIRTYGLEVEMLYTPLTNFSIGLISTIQDSRYVKFDYYNTNGTNHPVYIGESYPAINPVTGSSYSLPNGEPIAEGTPSDDYLESFAGNRVPVVPLLVADITPSYQISKNFSVNMSFKVMTQREGNRRGTFKMPAFFELGGSINWMVNKHFNLSLSGRNLLNEGGIMEFESIGIPGKQPDDLTVDLANTFQATNRPVFVKTIMPRFISLTAGFSF